LLAANASCRTFVSSLIMSLALPVSIDFTIEAGEVGADKFIGWTSGVDKGAGSTLMTVSHFNSGDKGVKSAVDWSSSPGMLFGWKTGSDLSVLHELIGACGLCSISLCSLTGLWMYIPWWIRLFSIQHCCRRQLWIAQSNVGSHDI
jgi:hypothetical protein